MISMVNGNHSSTVQGDFYEMWALILSSGMEIKSDLERFANAWRDLFIEMKKKALRSVCGLVTQNILDTVSIIFSECLNISYHNHKVRYDKLQKDMVMLWLSFLLLEY